MFNCAGNKVKRQEMNYEPEKVLELLKLVADKAKVGKLDYPSCIKIVERVNDEMKGRIGEKYLYRLHLSATKAAEAKTGITPKPRESCINILAEYAGYKGYEDFLAVRAEELEELYSYIGNWYSYVRSVSGEEEVQISPVRIYSENGKMWIELKGPEKVFKGELYMKADCLVCLLRADKGKEIHLVFKAGVSMKPSVLQGVFSGISTAGDPIAGREVLVRQDEDFSRLQSKRLSISRLKASDDPGEKSIGEYFEEYLRNNLKAGQSSTFGISDLIIDATAAKKMGSKKQRRKPKGKTKRKRIG